jgi:asparagine synthase (glutamine-hydrolysing)
MCGILGVVDFKNRDINPESLARLRDTMFHRGPDDDGLFVDGSVGLGHRRLSIIDLTSAGHQPMTNEDGSIHVVFNGEIYNYVELARDLRARGHYFHSSTDTEVILHQYEEDGERCVEKFRGMFAFALWDRRQRRLFAARDRFGIKPLYYYHSDDRLILASEIKAILEDQDVPRRPDMQGLADYLYAARALGRKTLFEGIHELEPGCSLSVGLHARSVEIRRYWQLNYDYNTTRSAADTAAELRSIVEESVKVHCRSDATLGCHLSGGLDSSAVVALAARQRERMKTFSIKFSEDPHIDETRYSRAVAAHVGADYQEWSPTADDLAELLPFLVWHMDMPMATDGGFAYYTVSRFAREHVKVSLTGHGGDEIFAGYPAQFQAAYNSTGMFNLYQDPDRIATRPSLLSRALRRSPLGLYRSLRRRAAGRGRTLAETWAALHCDCAVEESPLIEPGFMRRLNGYSPRELYAAPFSTVGTDDPLDQCLFHDLTVYLPSLLHLEDRVSMAVSLESRVPLLDHRVVEFLATVPPAQKVPGLRPKFLLRQMASSLLPEDVWGNRDKRGFPVPGRFWRTPQVDALIREVLLSPDSLDRGIFRPESLRQACDSHGDVSVFWPLVNVELWFKIFIDRNPVWTHRARARAAAQPA